MKLTKNDIKQKQAELVEVLRMGRQRAVFHVLGGGSPYPWHERLTPSGCGPLRLGAGGSQAEGKRLLCLGWEALMLRVPAAAPHRVRQTVTAALPPAAWTGLSCVSPRPRRVSGKRDRKGVKSNETRGEKPRRRW